MLKLKLIKIFFGLILFLSGNVVMAQSKSWKKYGLDNTQLYFFRLPEGVDHQSIRARVLHKRAKSVPLQIYFNGKLIKRKREFIYIANKTNVLYGQKLHFYLPAQTWVFAFNYNDAFLLVDDAMKIEISQANKSSTSKWQLPEIFDMRSDQALSLRALRSKTTDELNSRFISTLSLQRKEEVPNVLQDTVLYFSLSKLPKGLPLICKDINLKDHANQEFIVETGFLYHNTFFFYLPTAGAKILTNHPDQCQGKMTDVNGNIGYASGCITGLGSGKCAGILAAKETRKYRITLLIEPN